MSDVLFTATPELEHEPIRGNFMISGDDAYDEKCARDIELQIEKGNPWAWCCVEVHAKWRGLTGVNYLGCYSNSKDELDKETYAQMKAEAYADLIRQIESLAI